MQRHMKKDARIWEILEKRFEDMRSMIFSKLKYERISSHFSSMSEKESEMLSPFALCDSERNVNAKTQILLDKCLRILEHLLY